MAKSRMTRTGRSPHRTVRKQGKDFPTQRISAIVGVVLIGLAAFWFIWLLARQVNPALPALSFHWPDAHPAASDNDPLNAAGITLAIPPQSPQPLLGQQQAVLLADQMQPDAASKAENVSVAYVLLSYSGSNSATPKYQQAPAWAIHYVKVKEPDPDTAADPQAKSIQHDCYVFLDANTGKELMAIWV